ncbi:MAG TPA: L-aspartate oxidase [Candidatus Baltobacteraceae bacterium]|jgi:L-aspartate oxidase|nr:L-aspartate oxidase [Candidatus Baltobacteraceae bacterium]
MSARASGDIPIVVGAGLAGATAALEIARHRPVILLSAEPLGEGTATGWAQGGIAAAVGGDDAAAFHAADTLAVAGGIADARAVASIIGAAANAVAYLESLGVCFDRDAAGVRMLGREAAHGHSRILHAGGDATGSSIQRALVARIRREERIRVIERATAEHVVRQDDRVVGLLARIDGELVAFRGPVVLATGGIGALYRSTTNPPHACGDGIALAGRAGATLVDLEFVQFHPTALEIGRDPMPLVTEALRGAGASVVDENGMRFLLDFDARAELAPRDVVARAVALHRSRGHRTFLDARSLGTSLSERFPTVFASCRSAGIDPCVTPIPIAPAAHFHMGGIAVDLRGRSSLSGLWACGEVSSTGLHGANRLASNSLLEATVLGLAVGRDIVASLALPVQSSRAFAGALRRCGGGAPFDSAAFAELRALMEERVGLVRDLSGLSEAHTRISRLVACCASDQLRRRLLVAEGIVQAASQRLESRGAHALRDYPAADPHLAHRNFLRIDSQKVRAS